MNMSLRARNSAYNNGEHVGPDFARIRGKTESWIAGSKALRGAAFKHLDLPYAPGERTKWDLYPANDPKAPCFVHDSRCLRIVGRIEVPHRTLCWSIRQIKCSNYNA